MSDSTQPSALHELTAEIVAAYVAHNSISAEGLPALIQSVHATLGGLGQTPAEPERPEPAVPVRKSVQPDHIVCLEDGAKLKMLKRYLATRYDMTPEQYRQRWGLPSDYPMVAPNYSERRTALAKQIGLGRKRQGDQPPAAAKPAGRRGRKAAAAVQEDDAEA